MNAKRKEKIEKRKRLNEWSKKVRERDGCCVICGTTEHLNAHHIVPKELKNNALIFDIRNGISLCSKHHKFSYDISPHKNPLKFFIWLQKNRKEQFEYCLKNADLKST